MKDYIKIAEELAEICKRLYDKNYIAGVEGNLSVRLPENRILITPGGLNKGFIAPGDMVVCDPDGIKLDGACEPSSELKVHLAVYQHRTDINAVCHAHPVFATAFSLAGISFNEAILPEFVISLGIAPLVEYATPGSDRLASNLMEMIEKYDAFLLQAHGTLTLGESLAEAYNRTEMLERYARILFRSRQLGNIRLLPIEEAKNLLDKGGRRHLEGDIIGSEKS